MTKEIQIELEIQRTIDYLEHGERLNPDPLFYARLRDHIDGLRGSAHTRGKARTILKPALLLLILALNIIALTSFAKYRESESLTREEEALKEIMLDSSQDFLTF